jgi:hypothetical protein
MKCRGRATFLLLLLLARNGFSTDKAKGLQQLLTRLPFFKP